MKLSEYLKKKAISEKDFAAQLAVRGKPKGVTQQTVDLWARGLRIPRPNAMQAIFSLTNGRVRPQDFYNVAA